MSKNDITGDNIATKPVTEKYANGWNLIWGDKKKQLAADIEESKTDSEWDPIVTFGDRD